MQRTTHLIALTLAAGIPAAASAFPARYIIIDLGDLGGPIAARAINADGHAAGTGILTNGAHRGFAWDGTSPLALPPAAGFTQSEATDIDDAGRIVLLSYTLGRIEPRATLVDGLTLTDLGTFVPQSIDPAGRILGARPIIQADLTNTQRACVWDAGALSDLPSLQGSEWSAAADADSSGRIVGWATPAGSLRPRAVVWFNGAAHDLGTLGGVMAEARAINDSGLVVGISTDAGNEPHAFAYQLGAGASVLSRTDLGWLSAHQSAANGVNNDGEIVGTSNARAFLYADGTMIDLNTRINADSGWTLVGAAGINDAGQIVGWGTHNGTHRSAFLLTPTCDADLTADGLLNFFDVAAYIALYNAGDPRADFAAPFGTLNFFDLAAYIGLYNAGCP